MLVATAAALFLCAGATAAINDPQPVRPMRSKIDVPLEHGSYRLLTEAISYEIFAPNSAEAAEIKLQNLRDTQLDIRVCINGDMGELQALGGSNSDDEKRTGAKTIVWVSEDGRDFAELSNPPVIDAPDGTLANHRREVVQRPRYWEDVHTHETPAYDQVPPIRTVMKRSLAYIGPCTGHEFNLSPEWKELVRKKFGRDL